jgi:isocitrate dehydrogenase
LERNAMMVSNELFTETIAGVDMFLESSEQPEVIAQKCEHHGGNKFKLVNISNRGTQVWPTGSRYTNLINLYNVRFESITNQPLTQLDIIGLYVTLCADFKICSFELLNMWDDKRAYSLAQGQ